MYFNQHEDGEGHGHHSLPPAPSEEQEIFSHLAGMSPYISLKIKKRHYEYHMIETHIQ
jgi:hypothetical protein